MKQAKSRTLITEQDSAQAIVLLHQAWRRDMALALGAVDTQNAAVDRMDALRTVHKIRSGEE